jgi:hypothetical protein
MKPAACIGYQHHTPVAISIVPGEAVKGIRSRGLLVRLAQIARRSMPWLPSAEPSMPR